MGTPCDFRWLYFFWSFDSVHFHPHHLSFDSLFFAPGNFASPRVLRVQSSCIRKKVLSANSAKRCHPASYKR